MKSNRLVKIIIFSGLLTLFLSFSNPSSIPLPLLLVPYLLSGLIIYEIVYLVLDRLVGFPKSKHKLNLYALLITVLFTNFMLLKSIGQLTVQDALISLAIIVVSTVYIGRFSLGN
jgi:hypothetical protein